MVLQNIDSTRDGIKNSSKLPMGSSYCLQLAEPRGQSVQNKGNERECYSEVFICHSTYLPWCSHAVPVSASPIISLPFRHVFGICCGRSRRCAFFAFPPAQLCCVVVTVIVVADNGGNQRTDQQQPNPITGPPSRQGTAQATG